MFLSSLATPAPLAADSSEAAVLGDLAFLRQTVGQFEELAALGVHDDFAQQVKQMHEDPITAGLDMLQKVEGQLWRQVQAIVLTFLRQKRDLLRSAYQVQRAGVLEYVLVPTQPGLATEFVFDELLCTYSQTGLAQRFPVVFHFIRPEMVPDLQHVETVTLGE